MANTTKSIVMTEKHIKYVESKINKNTIGDNFSAVISRIIQEAIEKEQSIKK